MNKIKERSYFVIIGTDAMSTAKSFVVKQKYIQRAMAVLSVLLIIFGFMIYDYMSFAFKKHEIEKYKNKIAELDKVAIENNGSNGLIPQPSISDVIIPYFISFFLGVVSSVVGAFLFLLITKNRLPKGT